MNVDILTKAQGLRLAILMALQAWFSCASASSIEALSTIRLVAEQFAVTQIDKAGLTNIEATALNIDSRLQLEKCNLPLETFATSNSGNIARSTVAVRCSGLKPWTLYVPVRISAEAEAVVTRQPLVRGDPLLVEYLDIKRVSLDKLPDNYLSDIAQLGNMEVVRAVNSGVILTLNSIRPRQLVQQGQEVVILARGKGLQVRMNGIALKNGASGDIIPIRNSKSGRTVEAQIVNGSTVVVNR